MFYGSLNGYTFLANLINKNYNGEKIFEFLDQKEVKIFFSYLFNVTASKF